MTVLIGALAGSLGALVRYLASGAVQQRTRSPLPLGTASVNLVGAFALGLVVGAGPAGTWWVTAVAGFLGGFTTFSTWMVETLGLGAAPRPSTRAAVNLVGLAALGVVLAAAGYYLTT